MDFWALGVVCFQLLVGETPFEADEPQAVYARILEQAERGFNPPIEDLVENADAVNLIQQLLVAEPSHRLGATAIDGSDVSAILAHAFFETLDMENNTTPLFERKSPAEVGDLLDAFLLGDDGAEENSTETTKYGGNSTETTPPTTTSSVDRAFDELMSV